MAAIFGTCLIFLITFQLLQGLELIESAAAALATNFSADRNLAVCARLLALEANLQAARQFWQIQGCSESNQELEAIKVDLDQRLEDWQDFYPQLEADGCALSGALRLQLHLEKNPRLSSEYPNWTVRYTWDQGLKPDD